MAANADSRTGTVGHSPTTGLVQLPRDFAQLSARADGGLPGGVVYAEVLEIDHVDSYRSVLATEA